MTASKGRHRLSKSIRHPVGPQATFVYWRRRSLAIILVVGMLAGLGLVVNALLQLGRGANLVADGGTVSSTPTTTGVDGAPQSVADPTLDMERMISSNPPMASSTPSPSSAGNAPSPSATSQEAVAEGSWEDYPWGSNGLECPHPATSSGARDSGAASRVVVLGDSLVRNARSAIDAALGAYGIRPVFVCWGGKTLTWGAEQVRIMRDLNVAPDCLVINLGTNDLKGTTANGLADAVSLSTVEQRLTDFLIEIRDVPHVFAVDIAANLAVAPSTMSEVTLAPTSWLNAVTTSGVGEVVPWASAVRVQPNLIGADGIHDSEVGVTERATLIAQSVARYCI